MHDISELLSNNPLLSLLRQAAACGQAAPLQLVGGAIREALLGRPVVDFDFTSPHDLTACAQSLARQCNGHWFWLDQERRQSRVLAGGITCDFVSWRAASLEADLALRDYTINALALDLAAPLTLAALIDPLGGVNDLDRRILRLAGPDVLHDDPLRILKGIRHVAALGLEIEPATLSAMRAAAPELLLVAPERLRYEIWQILGAPSANLGFDGLLSSGVGKVLFGLAFPGALPFVLTALERARQLFATLAASCSKTRQWLAEPVEQHLDRATLLTFSSVFHAIEATLPLRLARSWRFGRMATARIAALDNIRTMLWAELVSLPHRPRAIAQWALQYGLDPVDLLLGLGLQVDLPPEETARQLLPLLSMLGDLEDTCHLSSLVDGSWLNERLGLEGEMIGTALAALRRAEIYGGIATVDDAHAFLLREFGKKSVGKKS